jgi:hypothetical protein
MPIAIIRVSESSCANSCAFFGSELRATISARASSIETLPLTSTAAM